MKIGLIGINRYAGYLNFACNLHAYAFQKYLIEEGHDATFLDYKPVGNEGMNLREPANFAENKYLSTIKETARTPEALKSRNREARRWAELAMGYRALTDERKTRFDKFEAFISENLRFTKEKYDSDLLEVEDPGMDCYICVTDVIWQPWLPKYSFDRGFMLGSKAFEGKPKIAYAPSRGAKPDFESPYAEEFFEYLDDIDAISARETDFSRYIEENSAHTAPTVIDPVLLHNREFWDKLAVKPQEERYLLLYYVMERATDTVAKAVEYAKAHDLTVVELSDRPLPFGKISDPDVKHIPRYGVSAEEWLGYIAHADAVFTNSFHGCCFSMIFEKLFFVGKRNGNKVPNFLAEFHLRDQQFTADDDAASFSQTIDFGPANARWAEFRASSEKFIQHALKSAEQLTASDSTAKVAKAHKRRRSLSFSPHFHSGSLTNADSDSTVTVLAPKPDATFRQKTLKSRALEYTDRSRMLKNTGEEPFEPSRFKAVGHRQMGWTIRFRIDNRWFWFLDDGSIKSGSVSGSELNPHKRVYSLNDQIPHIPVNSISTVVFVAQWAPEVRRRKSSPAAVIRKVIGKVARS